MSPIFLYEFRERVLRRHKLKLKKKVEPQVEGLEALLFLRFHFHETWIRSIY